MNVVDIANSSVVGRSPAKDAGETRVKTTVAPSAGGALAALMQISPSEWQSLSERAIEPNGYYLPGWELAVNACSRGRTGASALRARSGSPSAPDSNTRLIGLLPVISLWRACKIPLPALAAADPYGTLRTPLLDRGMALEAAAGLMRQAREAGAHALWLPDVSVRGAAMKAFNEVLKQNGLQPVVLQSHARACLNATRDAEDLLRDGLGVKKMKELRRQRHRLAEQGEVRFEVARTTDDVAAAVETFMTLEASGWKGERGTALQQSGGDASFIRRATRALSETGQCEIVTLLTGRTPIAAAIVLRHRDRAFYFKIGIDQRFSKFSPGVQLTLDLTRHLCADPAIASADSTATPDHPMINPIWRARFEVGDVLIPLRRHDPVVALIHAALWLRQTVRHAVRGAVHFIRRQRQRS